MEDIKFAVLPDPRTEPTISVQRAAQVIGVSRGSAYEGVRRGEIPSIRIGHRLLVPTAALLRLVGLEQSPSATRPAP
ncbi:MAG TPA: helix-turn-helix domain-containing protein [Acidimicrobiia bacterium]|nr:helix-turn-helix domain-containing protein [Acidimicrobiia bacterium]